MSEQLMVTELLAPELRELLEQQKFDEARDVLVELMDPELADLILALEEEDARTSAFRLLPTDRAACVITYFPGDEQARLVGVLAGQELAPLINEMEVDDRSLLFEQLPAQLSAKCLGMMPAEERQKTLAILGYPPESVGRLMTPDFLTMRPDWTVQQALNHVRARGRDVETINTLYVIDARGHLLDGVRLRQLFFTSPQTRIRELMDEQLVSLHATDDREEAVRVMQRYDRPVLPVVDEQNVLVGIVTFDDVADVAEEEATEDIQKQAAVSPLETTYIATSLLSMFKARSTWLAVLFVGQLLTATAMEAFEAELEAALVLTLFLPLIISSGGNSGSQATSLIIRAMALGEVALRDWWRVFRRELVTGLLLGLLLGLLGLGRVELWQWLGWADYSPQHVRVALTVGGALVGVVLWGSVVGSMLPFALRRLGLDPATSSAPFVATLVDVTGLVMYLTVAKVVLLPAM